MQFNLPGGDEALQKAFLHHPWAGYAQSALVVLSFLLNVALIGLIFAGPGGVLVSRLRPAPWNFSRGMETLSRYLFVYFGVMILVLMAKQEFGPALQRIGFGDLNLMVLGTGLIQALSVGVIWLFAREQKHTTGELPGSYWMGRPKGRLYQGILVFVIVLFPVGLTMVLTKAVFDQLGLPFDSQPLVTKLSQTDATWFVAVLSIFAVIVAPVIEEIFFRGILFPTLKARWGIWPSAVISSLIFAAMHFHLPTFLPLFVLAMILSLTFEYTGSLAVCMIAHSLFNSLSIIAIWVLRSSR